MTLQSRADQTMQKTFSNIEFYAPDNFHSWGAPPPTQKKQAMYRPVSMRFKGRMMSMITTLQSSLCRVNPIFGRTEVGKWSPHVVTEAKYL